MRPLRCARWQSFVHCASRRGRWHRIGRSHSRTGIGRLFQRHGDDHWENRTPLVTHQTAILRRVRLVNLGVNFAHWAIFVIQPRANSLDAQNNRRCALDLDAHFLSDRISACVVCQNGFGRQAPSLAARLPSRDYCWDVLFHLSDFGGGLPAFIFVALDAVSNLCAKATRLDKKAAHGKWHEKMTENHRAYAYPSQDYNSEGFLLIFVGTLDLLRGILLRLHKLGPGHRGKRRGLRHERGFAGGVACGVHTSTVTRRFESISPISSFLQNSNKIARESCGIWPRRATDGQLRAGARPGPCAAWARNFISFLPGIFEVD